MKQERLKIDLNCDLGEGFNNEAALMPHLSSCNIACGAHAGSTEIIDEVLALALKHGVKIGAHPSYPDRENFGRQVLPLSEPALKASLSEQLKSFKARAELQGAKVEHVKAHGALYNQIAAEEAPAQLVCSLIAEIFPKAKIYLPYASVAARVAQARGMTVVFEAFADRRYRPDLSLVPRSESDALITEPKAIVAQVLQIAKQSRVTCNDGLQRPIKAETFCLHGDHPMVLETLNHLQLEIQSIK